MTAPIIADGSNKSFHHEVSTSAPPSAVWSLWTDVTTWKLWDKGLKDALSDGHIMAGSRGTIIPLSGPKLKYSVSEFAADETYTFVTKMPLARLVIKRSMVGKAPTRFRHDVWFEGPLASVWARMLGPEFRKSLPESMQLIKSLAEKAG